MKKIVISIIILISILLLLPIIGNQLVKETLDKKIELLKSKGIEVKNSITVEKYLSTSRHYEFLLKDSDKFLEYISQYSDKQLASYTSALLKGTLIGVDLKYNNIPFSKDIYIDIYPITFSDEIMSELKRKDKSFFEYIENFLFNKGILYHINYNIITQDFDGFIKDIDEKQTLQNNSKLIVHTSNISFNGNGSLIAPSFLKTNVDKMNLGVSNSLETRLLNINKLSTASTFDSKTTYLTSAKLKSFFMDIKTSSGNNGSLNISDIYLNLSSNTQTSKAELNFKSSFSKMIAKTDKTKLEVSSFNYDLELDGVDKDSFEELRVLIKKSKTLSSFGLVSKVRKSAMKLLLNGLELYIADFSIKNISVNNIDLDGFKVKSKLLVKEDKIFVSKNVDLDFNLKVSKKIFLEILKFYPMAVLSQSYAKDNGDSLVFDISFKDNDLKVNNR